MEPVAGTRGHSIQETVLWVEFGDFLADVFKRSDAGPPSWSGQTGVGGDFYSDDGKVLFVSETAGVDIASWKDGTVADADLQEMLDELRVIVG